MRYIYLFILILAVSFTSCKPKEVKSSDYPDTDAVYLDLKKTFILNKDGSIVQKVEKKQKLFTYRSFHSLYGDTRITYNPDFQTVKVDESYTVMADGKKVKSPANAYNEVLPRSCANSKAFNRMRELVVSHTALERNAVINCKYQITTTRGIFPYLMGNEVLVTSCPVKQMSIVVQVPKGTELNYTLYGSPVKPKKSSDENNDIYEWKFKDLPQHIKEAHEDIYSKDLPRLVFSTQESRKKLIDAVSNQPAFMIHDLELPQYVENAVKGLTKPTDIALKIQHIVVDEVNLIHVPGILTGFRYRIAKSIWESNSASAMEKAVLMSSLLKSAGVNNFICMKYHELLNGDKKPFILDSEPVIIFNSEDGSLAYMSPVRKNRNYAEIKQPGYACIPVGYKIEQVVDFKAQPGEIAVSGDLTLSESSVLKGFFVGTFNGSSNPFFQIKSDDKALNKLMPGWKGSIDSLSVETLKVVFNGEHNESGEIRGDHCFLTVPSSAEGIAAKHFLPLSIERRSDLYFGHPLKESYSFNITVPEGYKLVNDKISETIETPAGKLIVNIEQSENIVKYNKSIEISKTVIPVKEYQQFKDLITEWGLDKNNKLVFEMN